MSCEVCVRLLFEELDSGNAWSGLSTLSADVMMVCHSFHPLCVSNTTILVVPCKAVPYNFPKQPTARLITTKWMALSSGVGICTVFLLIPKIKVCYALFFYFSLNSSFLMLLRPFSNVAKQDTSELAG